MKIHRNRHFWIILLIFILCSLLHYIEQLGAATTTVPDLHFGLTRHALDRILFLLPIIYAGFVFGLIGGLATCFAALLVMLPRATFISPVPPDAILEVAGVTIVGVLASVWLWKRGKEREAYRASLLALESAHALLQKYVRTARNTEKRLTTVNALFTVLNESLELQSVLRRAVHMIMELMDVEIVLIFSLDEKTQELEALREQIEQALAAPEPEPVSWWRRWLPWG